MTSEAVAQARVTSRPGRSAAPLIALGWREARRILKSPIYVAVGLIGVAAMGIPTAVSFSFPPDLPSAAEVYEFIFFLTVLYAGLLTYMAAHLVASSSRRTHADRQLAASPVASRSRGGGLCLGVVFGPGAAALILMVVAAFVRLADGTQPVRVAELAQVILTVVGAGLFGVLSATWLRFPGSLPIGLAVLVVGTILLADPDRGTGTLGWFAPWVASPEWTQEPWTRLGSQTWHAFYLAGLCAMAVCAVMLRERENRSRWIVASAVALAATAAAGWAQL